MAALGPSAAMAIATTFGTASTGTAISALGGAAATNAALAWLGGGALAAGGTGIEGGTAFLALAGPVGWAIAGVGLTAGGVLYNSHNKKAMQADDQQSLELQSGLKALDGTKIEINKISRLTQRQDILLQSEFKEIQLMDSDFEKLDEKSKKQLGAFVNNVLSATKLLNQKVGSNN
ncbi:hypothetical protein [Furfurilactobacillus rossiae]|uniref:Uncharacterized protein n=2 Tax=Furfurilactobacillus rossiae TaxID=231049 RepID=A0A0R1RGW3_9LACO|nr:hypothetical protein [Furfurilactobacillus rossiae]KRL53522.1 hypothetical protein FD35_GL001061 [Furfurilactobacillus rossiae DSM 15814]QFR67657.1 hypothetical protein LR814_11310 [Furfurilactobacillus rossiae]QLE60618.1 hypothetical protein LROSRS0_0570 [Furfurilactobacillus rossiae]